MSGDSATRDPLAEARDELRKRQGIRARYDSAGAPAQELAWARLGTAYFARKLNELPDDALWRPAADQMSTRRRVVAACALEARAIAQAIERAIGAPADGFAETDGPALDLAETLPSRALRHLLDHACLHLNVTWRDLSDVQWDVELPAFPAAATPRASAAHRAREIWAAAYALDNRGSLHDAPAGLRSTLEGRHFDRR